MLWMWISWSWGGGGIAVFWVYQMVCRPFVLYIALEICDMCLLWTAADGKIGCKVATKIPCSFNALLYTVEVIQLKPQHQVANNHFKIGRKERREKKRKIRSKEYNANQYIFTMGHRNRCCECFQVTLQGGRDTRMTRGLCRYAGEELISTFELTWGVNYDKLVARLGRLGLGGDFEVTVGRVTGL
jgi:hypothetical protein